jgi:hypothetical protein
VPGMTCSFTALSSEGMTSFSNASITPPPTTTISGRDQGRAKKPC